MPYALTFEGKSLTFGGDALTFGEVLPSSGNTMLRFGYGGYHGMRIVYLTTEPVIALTVSGAGETAANGGYIQSGTIGGKPRYTKGGYSIFWSTGDSFWIIESPTFDNLYTSDGGEDFPWEAISWSGSPAPNPTVTEG